MTFDAQTTILIILTILLLFIVLFSVLKGVIRMILLAMAVIGSIAMWIFLQNKGFILLAQLTDTPRPWMVQTLAWTLSIFTFIVFFHGMNWFSHLFSWRRGGASPTGIITTILMSALMLWVVSIAVSYYGNIARVSYYCDLASAHIKGQSAPAMPWFTRAKNALRKAEATAWLRHIDPLEAPAQTNLACLVAYGCSLSEPEFTKFYNERLAHSGVPHAARFLELFRDKGLRTLVQEGSYVSLLENERLNAFLQMGNTEEILAKII